MVVVATGTAAIQVDHNGYIIGPHVPAGIHVRPSARTLAAGSSYIATVDATTGKLVTLGSTPGDIAPPVLS